MGSQLRIGVWREGEIGSRSELARFVGQRGAVESAFEQGEQRLQTIEFLHLNGGQTELLFERAVGGFEAVILLRLQCSRKGRKH